MHLVRRWCGMEADVIKTRLPGIKYLSCYFRDKKTHGAFVPIDREEQIPEYRNPNHYIKLTEFAEYLKSVEYVLDIKIPFPRVLLLSRRVRYSYDSKTMANAEEEAILRNKEVEEHIWQTAIDPLLRKCGLNFEFKFTEGDYSELDVWKVTKLSVDSCNGLPKINSVFEILVRLQEGISISDGVKNTLGGFFHELFSDENDGNLLPAFIELIAQHKCFHISLRDAIELENADSKPVMKEKKLRPDQRAKRGVLEIGKKMREKDPNITKAAIGRSEEVKNACIRIAKKEFHPLVISYRWLKDL